VLPAHAPPPSDTPAGPSPSSAETHNRLLRARPPSLPSAIPRPEFTRRTQNTRNYVHPHPRPISYRPVRLIKGDCEPRATNHAIRLSDRQVQSPSDRLDNLETPYIGCVAGMVLDGYCGGMVRPARGVVCRQTTSFCEAGWCSVAVRLRLVMPNRSTWLRAAPERSRRDDNHHRPGNRAREGVRRADGRPSRQRKKQDGAPRSPKGCQANEKGLRCGGRSPCSCQDFYF